MVYPMEYYLKIVVHRLRERNRIIYTKRKKNEQIKLEKTASILYMHLVSMVKLMKSKLSRFKLMFLKVAGKNENNISKNIIKEIVKKPERKGC